jgi:hypothetical protein
MARPAAVSVSIQRWIAVEELDEETLPEDCGHLLVLYRAWLEGNY